MYALRCLCYNKWHEIQEAEPCSILHKISHSDIDQIPKESIKKGMGEYLKRKVRQVSKFHPEIKIIEVNTNIDHMHMMVSIPPKMPVSSVVRLIKTNTGKAMRKHFPFLDKVYWGVEGIWSIGYFVSTVGISEEAI